MPKKIRISDADMSWLRNNHNNHTYPELAKRIGVCTDTLKRILVREGLQDFAGAKYQSSRSKKSVNHWRRPCLRCKNTNPRPRMQFLCDPCKARGDYDPWV